MPGMRLEAPRVQDNQPAASAYDMYITAGCTFMVSILLYNVVHNLQFEDLEYRIWRWATCVVILVDILLGMYRKRITRAEICAYWSGLFLFLTVDVHVINYLGEVLCWNVTKVAAMMAVTACESAVIVYVWAHVRGIAHKRDKVIAVNQAMTPGRTRLP